MSDFTLTSKTMSDVTAETGDMIRQITDLAVKKQLMDKWHQFNNCWYGSHTEFYEQAYNELQQQMVMAKLTLNL